MRTPSLQQRRANPDLAEAPVSPDTFAGTPFLMDSFQTYAELTAAGASRSRLRQALHQDPWVLGAGGGISMAGGTDRRILRFGTYKANVAFSMPGCELWSTEVTITLPEACPKEDVRLAAKRLAGVLTPTFGRPAELSSGRSGCLYKNVEVSMSGNTVRRTLTVEMQRISCEDAESPLETLEALFPGEE